MASRVAICNLALAKIGEQLIESLTGRSKAAEVLNAIWDPIRDAVLRDFEWNFAAKRASLPALVEVPAFGFALQYQLPADCLKVREVLNAEAWSVEGRRILTDAEAPISIRYTAQVTDTGLFDVLYVDALACRLAVECATALTNSNTKAEAAYSLYTKALSRARLADAEESLAATEDVSSWITARDGGGF